MEQDHKEKYQKPLKQKYVRPQDQVTEETEIPEVPKELLQPPNEKTLESQISNLKAQIETLKKEEQIFIETTIANINSKKNQTHESIGPLKEDLAFKKKKFYDLKPKFAEFRSELEKANVDYEEQLEKLEKIQLKMKNNSQSSENIQKEIISLKEQISHGKISLKQEKDIVAQISLLESILPYSFQHDEIQKTLKEKVAAKKIANQNYFQIKDQMTTLKTHLKTVEEQISDFQSMSKEDREKIKPLLDKKRQDTDEKIAVLQQKIKDTRDAFYENEHLYKKQQELIEKIEWMKKEKKAIIQQKKAEKQRQEIRLKKEKELEEQRAQEEALQKELENDTYDENVSICNLLIDYCKKLLPKSAENQKNQNQQQQPQVDIEAKLKSKEWSKDNVTVLQPKKNQGNDDNVAGGKKIKQKKQDQEVNERVNHKVEVINLFDHVKVSPPMFTNLVADTLKLLAEKKEYFEKMPKEEKNQKREVINLQSKEQNKDKKDQKVKKQTPLVELQESSFPRLD